MEDFLCTCALAIHVLEFYVCKKYKQIKIYAPKTECGKGGGGYFVEIYQNE